MNNKFDEHFGNSAIKKAFEGKKAFIGFLTAGDPSIKKSGEYIVTLAKAGCDLIEIGIPFSDPVAEGPSIQQANIRALNNNVTTDDVFDMVATVRKEIDTPLVFLSYLNPIFTYGYDKFFKKCNELKVSGVIVPDLPFEEKNEVSSVSETYGVSVISLIAPTSEARIKEISKDANGFIYIVSSLGVTGVRKEIKTDLSAIVKDIRDVTDVPTAIGFGISTPDQRKEMANIADGAIVGSAIVDIIAENPTDAHDKLTAFVKSMISN